MAGAGDALQANDANLAEQYRQQGQGVEDYLNPIESTQAEGGGGYNPQETAAIQFSPQDQQNLITKAGISAGAGTASAVGAAERAAAAGGGNPAAMAAYRARAAQSQAGAAGDSMTNARVAAKQLESQGAQTTGNARLGQQNAALNYYQGLQNQKNQTALGEQGLGQGAYATETQGTGQASGQGVEAAKQPTTWDKIIGGVAGGVGAFLHDGTAGYMNGGGFDAVLGEDGPEAVLEGASDPARSHTRFMAEGGAMGLGENADLPAGNPGYDPVTAPSVNNISPLRDYLNGKSGNGGSGSQKPQEWTRATPYQQLGTAIGGALSKLADGTPGDGSFDAMPQPRGYKAGRFGARTRPDNWPNARHGHMSGGYMADGGMPDDMMAGGGFGSMRAGLSNTRKVTNYRPRPAMPPKIITAPTRVHLGPSDAVVPLSYRPNAKIRPSALMGAMG